jgi:uncharacterized cupredoxin-like copper-binding protein
MHRLHHHAIALLFAASLVTTSGCSGEPEAVSSPPETPAATGGAPAGHDHGALVGQGDAAAAAPASSSDVAETWAALRDLRDAIAADVEAGRLSKIHEKSERLAPLAEVLLERSTDLAPDRRTRVASAVRQVPKLAGSLHETADAGNAEATRRELGRLDGLLELIRAQYPAGALASPGPSAGPGAGAAVQHSGNEHAEHHGGHGSGEHQHAMQPLALVERPAVATLHVRGNEFRFEPRTLELRAGAPTQIELENGGAIEHSLVVKAPGGEGDWIHLHALPKETDTGVYEIGKPGRYPVLCTIEGHVEAGMVGELVVR